MKKGAVARHVDMGREEGMKGWREKESVSEGGRENESVSEGGRENESVSEGGREGESGRDGGRDTQLTVLSLFQFLLATSCPTVGLLTNSCNAFSVL